MYDPKNVKLRFSPKDGRNYFLGLFCKYNTFTSSTDSMEVISTTTTSLWLALLANPWLLLYLTDGGNILWDPVYQEQTRLREKNWLDQSQDAFIGIRRERYSCL